MLTKSTDSLWNRIIVNNKRRLWLWLFSIVLMLTRLFSISSSLVIIVLAIIAALEGYSYLFFKKRVDMFHSTPIPMNKRFWAIYVNGAVVGVISLAMYYILVLLFPDLGSNLPPGEIRIFLNLGMDVLMFLAAYSLSVLAVMLTGNGIMAALLSAMFIAYADAILFVVSTCRSQFYRAYTVVYNKALSGFSVFHIYGYANKLLRDSYTPIDSIVKSVIVAMLKECIWIIPAIWLSVINYRKRPAEAAGNSLAFYSARILIKLMVIIPVALLTGCVVFGSTSSSTAIAISSMILAAVVTSVLAEFVFELNLKSAFKHWGTVFVAFLPIITVFLLYRFDAFRYDSYVPKVEKVESCAVMIDSAAYYTNCINFNTDARDFKGGYIDPYVYARDNMYIIDTEAVIALANKSLHTDVAMMDTPVDMDVLYRLNNGKVRSRHIKVDFGDTTNDDYLNRIIGPAYYKMGIWQAMTMDAAEDRIESVTYVTSSGDMKLENSYANMLIGMWREDMSLYDYDRVRYDVETGHITITFDNWCSWNLPVYGCFDNVNEFMYVILDK